MERGDIYQFFSDGKQTGKQAVPVLIVSPKAFNEITGIPVILPITEEKDPPRMAGFAVRLTGEDTETTGIIRCDHPRALRLDAENSSKREHIPQAVLNEVLARLAAILE